MFRLVILDYLMLNTDHGLDKFMIKCRDTDHEKTPIDISPVSISRVDTPQMSDISKPNSATSGTVDPPTATPPMSALRNQKYGDIHSELTTIPYSHCGVAHQNGLTTFWVKSLSL